MKQFVLTKNIQFNTYSNSTVNKSAFRWSSFTKGKSYFGPKRVRGSLLLIFCTESFLLIQGTKILSKRREMQVKRVELSAHY